MGMHNNLPIYKDAFKLLVTVLGLVKNVPRDLKTVLGKTVVDKCSYLLVLIARANFAQNKGPHLSELIEKVQMVDFLMRALQDLHAIAPRQYASVVQLTESIGRQASGWKKNATSPVSSSLRQR